MLRHVKHVVFSEYEIKGAFPSPYPFDDASVIEAASSLESRDSTSPNVKGKGKALQPPAPMVVVHTNGNGASTSSSADREPLSAQSSTNEDDQPAKPQAKRATEARNKKDKQPISKVVTERLFVCRGCFKYLLYEAAYAQHEKTCKFKHPPGRKVYQRGATIIWEVDGADAKVLRLPCLSLCRLLSKASPAVLSKPLPVRKAVHRTQIRVLRCEQQDQMHDGPLLTMYSLERRTASCSMF